MARRRHKKPRQHNQAFPTQFQGRKSTPADQAFADRFALGGRDYLEQNFMRVMLDSGRLAEEPEFIDLYFDESEAGQITERWLRKYEKRLTAAEKRGMDAYRLVVDDMRIDVISNARFSK